MKKRRRSSDSKHKYIYGYNTYFNCVEKRKGYGLWPVSEVVLCTLVILSAVMLTIHTNSLCLQE